ncbi:LOW QUALITY PROTEIN: protein enabled homolog [Sarcophilus harrisii]|uniref:LOW QUALITY PROTEIN: protein enabled homolog n=1 Tax=Sarcophilus harrisii TaxID=9305 RepID=UPI001301E8F2|nr:LOW QUALITY PROTEIN: protein enabled homolog [Sarcophilus harrisii]
MSPPSPFPTSSSLAPNPRGNRASRGLEKLAPGQSLVVSASWRIRARPLDPRRTTRCSCPGGKEAAGPPEEEFGGRRGVSEAKRGGPAWPERGEEQEGAVRRLLRLLPLHPCPARPRRLLLLLLPKGSRWFSSCFPEPSKPPPPVGTCPPPGIKSRGRALPPPPPPARCPSSVTLAVPWDSCLKFGCKKQDLERSLFPFPFPTVTFTVRSRLH